MPINTMDTDDSTGLLGHFIGQVKFPFWSTPQEETKNAENQADYKGADQYKLYWNVSVLDILQEFEGEIPESVNKSFGIGKNWFPMASAPNQIRHEDDPGDETVEAGEAKPVIFKTVSGLGTFLALINGKLTKLETDDGPAVVMDDGGPLDINLRPLARYFNENDLVDSRDCDIWKGLIFEFRGVGLKYGDRKPRMNPYPVRWLPEFAGAVDLDKASGGRQGASEASTVDWTEFGATPDLADTLAKLAASSTSHAEFSRNALMLPAVKDDEKLSAAVMDESNGNWGA